MGAVTVGTVEATLHIVSMVKDHSQHDLVFQGILQGRGEVCGVDTRVVIHVGPGLQQRVDQFIVALSESHLQTVDGILVHHCPGLQQQAGALKIVVCHGEEEGGPALVVVAAAHPRVQHEVWVEASFQQHLETMGVSASCCGMKRTHPTGFN